MKEHIKFIKLKLFSPILVKGESPYENNISRFEDVSVSDSRLPSCKQGASLRAATWKGAQALCWDGGEDYRTLVEPEKKLCRSEIYEAISETLDPLVIPVGFEHTIYSAVPAIEEKDGRIMLVLNCECYRTLSESELDELCDWWENILSDANETLGRMQIKTKKLDRIYVHVWYLNGWSVTAVFPGGQ